MFHYSLVDYFFCIVTLHFCCYHCQILATHHLLFSDIDQAADRFLISSDLVKVLSIIDFQVVLRHQPFQSAYLFANLKLRSTCAAQSYARRCSESSQKTPNCQRSIKSQGVSANTICNMPLPEILPVVLLFLPIQRSTYNFSQVAPYYCCSVFLCCHRNQSFRMFLIFRCIRLTACAIISRY